MWILSTKEKLNHIEPGDFFGSEKKRQSEVGVGIVDGVYFLLHGDFMECVISFKGHSHPKERTDGKQQKTPLNFNVRQFTLSSRTLKYADGCLFTVKILELEAPTQWLAKFHQQRVKLQQTSNE